MKHISSMWSKMPKEQKFRYKGLSDTDRRRFDVEKKEIKRKVSGEPDVYEENKEEPAEYLSSSVVSQHPLGDYQSINQML